MRICAIDVGTNTVQSLVADIEPGGSLTVISDEERFARLGQGVDAERRLAADAMDRVLDRLARSKATAEHHGAERIVIGATSASRDATNVAELQRRVRDELGLEYEIVAGVDEATLSFHGALSMLPGVSAALVVDIGGGSTELARGTRSAVEASVSLNIGSVRLTERHVRTRPSAGAQAQAAMVDVRAALTAAPGFRQDTELRPMIATGSVARLVAKVAGGADGVVPKGAVESLRDRLLGSTVAETLALDPDAMAGREDVAAMAVLILDEVLDWFGAASFTATAGGLRHGLALRAGLSAG